MPTVGLIAAALVALVGLALMRAPGLGHGECELQKVPDTMEQLSEFPATCGLRLLHSTDRVRVYAYTQNGGWCWNSAGVVYDARENEFTLVDLLTDPKQTSAMLSAIKAELPEGAKLRDLVLTHCDIDHIGGFQLVQGQVGRVFAARGCEQAMSGFFKSDLGKGVTILHYAWSLLRPFSWALSPLFGGKKTPDFLAKLAVAPLLDPFAWHEVVDATALAEGKPLVTDVVEPGRHSLVGGLVTLVTLNPSHSNHDLAVEVDGTVLFAGDIVFNGVTPVNWAGTFDQSVQACEALSGWQGLIVPGHGAIQHSSQRPFNKMAGYWKTLKELSGREGFDPYGVLDALPEPYRGWEDAERSLINLLVEAKNRESPGGKIDKIGYLAEYMKIKFSNMN